MSQSNTAYFVKGLNNLLLTYTKRLKTLAQNLQMSAQNVSVWCTSYPHIELPFSHYVKFYLGLNAC